MTAVVIVFMIIAAIFALSSLGYVGYDIWKEVRAKKAQNQPLPGEEDMEQPQEELQEELQEQEAEEIGEPAETVVAE